MKAIIFLMLIFSGLMAMSQNSPLAPMVPDTRLEEAFGKKYIASIALNTPHEISRLNYYLDNSWYIMKKNVDKPITIQGSINLDPHLPINIYSLKRKYDLDVDWQLPMVYSIEHSEELLVLRPGKIMRQSFVNYLKEE